MTWEDYDAYVFIYVCELRVCLVFYKMKGLLDQPTKQSAIFEFSTFLSKIVWEFHLVFIAHFGLFFYVMLR